MWPVPAYSISIGYVQKWPSLPTHEGVSGEESTRNDERLIGEYDLLRSFGDLWGSPLGMQFTMDGNLLRSVFGDCDLRGSF